ncbi:hypothetical protein CASFOL_034181 [Castilleja foliolosa]|uniref:Uncharacterized protein n=1 Tax=Castilleja foliolosa TaxID=1961234 RepID=A0ABD3BZ97_9LAMI
MAATDLETVPSAATAPTAAAHPSSMAASYRDKIEEKVFKSVKSLHNPSTNSPPTTTNITDTAATIHREHSTAGSSMWRNEGDVCNFICPKLTNFSRRRVVNHDPTIGVENDRLRRCRRPPVGVIESYRDLGEKVVSAAKGICGGVWEDDGVARLGSEKAIAERGDWSSRGGDGGGSVASAGRLRRFWQRRATLVDHPWTACDSFPNRATTISLFPASTRTSQLRLPPSSKLHSTVYKGKDLQITLSILDWL